MAKAKAKVKTVAVATGNKQPANWDVYYPDPTLVDEMGWVLGTMRSIDDSISFDARFFDGYSTTGATEAVGHFVNGEKIDYQWPETAGEAYQRHLAKKKLARAGDTQLAARANAPIPKPVASAAKPVRTTKPIPSRTAPVGSRELAAAILADFGPAKCGDALARGLTYSQVAEDRIGELKADCERLQAELDRRERPRGVRFGGGFNAFGKHDRFPAA